MGLAVRNSVTAEGTPAVTPALDAAFVLLATMDPAVREVRYSVYTSLTHGGVHVLHTQAFSGQNGYVSIIGSPLKSS